MSETAIPSAFEWCPEASRMEAIGLGIDPASRALLQKTLHDPVRDFMSRPGKRFRARLVEAGLRLASPESPAGLTRKQRDQCARVAGIVEALHAGALIIDDIQDASRVRRGGPAFHIRHGVGRSINAANWLYFWALAQIQTLGLTKDRELRMLRECVDILSAAHLGQAIDLGTPIDEIPQSQVYSVCMTALNLKTGALVALSTSLGALLGGADAAATQSIGRLGCELGLALQKFDDAGNFSDQGAHLPKRYEDLALKRPSWAWAYAAKAYAARDYAEFVRSARHLPDESYLRAWVGLHDFEAVLKTEAKAEMERTLNALQARLGETHPRALAALRGIALELEKSYG